MVSVQISVSSNYGVPLKGDVGVIQGLYRGWVGLIWENYHISQRWVVIVRFASSCQQLFCQKPGLVVRKLHLGSTIFGITVFPAQVKV